MMQPRKHSEGNGAGQQATDTADLPESLPLSATVITLNEADRIAACIASLLPLVDEIVIVDSGSTDATVQIARALGAKVHHADWTGYGPQKRFAEELCRNDWIVSLDADERLTPRLAEQIRTLFASGAPPRSAYRLRIVDQLPHESEPASWAYAYERIRLYDRRAGRFADSLVHDDVAVAGDAEVGELSAPVSHVSFRSLSAAIDKFNRYTDMQVEDLALRRRGLPKWRLLTEFPISFFKSYIIRRRALYGWWGVILSMNYAYNRFLRIAKAFEIQQSHAASQRATSTAEQNDDAGPAPNVLCLKRDR